MVADLKKPCHDDWSFPCECLEAYYEPEMGHCTILDNGGTWEDCRFGKDWKEPGPPAFEGD